MSTISSNEENILNKQHHIDLQNKDKTNQFPQELLNEDHNYIIFCYLFNLLFSFVFIEVLCKVINK